MIGEKAEAEGADEQAGKGRRDEGADPGKAEEGLRRRGHQPAAGEARRDVTCEEQVVDLKAAAEREQDHQPPDITGRRQRLEPSRDLVGPACRRGKIDRRADIDGAHSAPPQVRWRQPFLGRRTGSAMFGSREPEIQTNISKGSFDIFDGAIRHARF
ncbi:hypothetical protein ACVMB0_001682 [Bradyrhizobium sp. USDA 4451]